MYKLISIFFILFEFMLSSKCCVNIPDGKSEAEGAIEPWGESAEPWGDSAEESDGEPIGAVEGDVGPFPAN